MAILPFLAMTASEMRSNSDFPTKLAWMACHFSPYGKGLTNLPQQLPHQSILILDDSTPIHGHDNAAIGEQLRECVETLDCYGILLDFQRPENPDIADLAMHLSQTLPCPVIVSECYAQELSCPIFLPPVPPSVTLREYLSHWIKRDIWLEIGLTGEVLTLTEQGCSKTQLSCPDIYGTGFSNSSLHCHYLIDISKKSARFTLWRTLDDWLELLKEAQDLGIAGAIGLFQELQDFPQPS